MGGFPGVNDAGEAAIQLAHELIRISGVKELEGHGAVTRCAGEG